MRNTRAQEMAGSLADQRGVTVGKMFGSSGPRFDGKVFANRQPAVVAYLADPANGGHQFYGVMVLTIEGDEIAAITGFQDPGLSEYFGLPAWLSADRE